MRTLAHRLLLAGSGSGFEVPDMAMSTAELDFWRDQAALLDPDAYAFVQGTGESATVPSGERWYLVNGWFLKVHGSGAGHWYHRDADVREAMLLPEGHTIETSASQANTFMYLCKPSLVTGSGAYQTDPRGLYFQRMMRLAELEVFQLGATATSSSGVNAAFPTDFTDGLVVQVSAHDLAWVILLAAGLSTGGINTLNEISDTNRIRFAEACLFPFKRTQFPSIRVMGVSQSEGAGNVSYVKLPADW